MTWNYNMDEAPKGHYETRQKKGHKGIVTDVQVHIPQRVIVCSGTCNTVSVSQWLPDEGRWEFYTKSNPPAAWIEFPKHPNLK